MEMLEEFYNQITVFLFTRGIDRGIKFRVMAKPGDSISV